MTTATAEKENDIAHCSSRAYGHIDETRPSSDAKSGRLDRRDCFRGRNGPFFLWISPIGTGIIYSREYNRAKDIIRALVPGDKITVKIAELENERGYFSLSLKEAKQKMV